MGAPCQGLEGSDGGKYKLPLHLPGQQPMSAPGGQFPIKEITVSLYWPMLTAAEL